MNLFNRIKPRIHIRNLNKLSNLYFELTLFTIKYVSATWKTTSSTFKVEKVPTLELILFNINVVFYFGKEKDWSDFINKKYKKE